MFGIEVVAIFKSLLAAFNSLAAAAVKHLFHSLHL